MPKVYNKLQVLHSSIILDTVLIFMASVSFPSFLSQWRIKSISQGVLIQKESIIDVDIFDICTLRLRPPCLTINFFIVPPERLELSLLSELDPKSSGSTNFPKKAQLGVWDSNPQPIAQKAIALPFELTPNKGEFL